MSFVRLSSALAIAASLVAQTVAQGPTARGPQSRVTSLEIISRRPAFGGKAFGAVGPYEVLIGQARAVIDPRHPLNQIIADLDKAPRNASGLVEYSFDVQILKPVDLAKGNGVLTYEVNNRGGRLVYSYFNEAGTGFEESNIGNAFIMNHGHTFVWSGWQGDLTPTAANPPILTARLPVATDNGQPIVGRVREEWIRDTAKAPVRRLTYPAATLDQTQATLSVRVNEGDPRRVVSTSEWSFTDSTTIDIKEAPGTDAGAIYELTYTARNPIVLGIGYAGIRDLVSFLRHSPTDDAGGANPLFVNGKPAFRAAVSTGTSQSGRVQRDFIYLGFNQDTAGRKVFDGMNPIVGGGRRTFVNFRFGQPGRYTRQHEDHMYPMSEFPFTYATTTDPMTGKTDGLFARCSASKSCPKVIQLDADSEAYQGQASLILTDTRGQDVKLPDEVRYWYLNTAHAQGEIGCRDAPNTVSPWPYYRASFDALVRWVRDGAAPPPTSAPSVAKGTFITPAEQAAQHPKIPGKPYVAKMSELGVRDFSVFPPTESAKKYPLLVQKLDKDGNPTAGIIVPEIAAPLATISGRSVRRKGFAEGELCSTAGSTIPFAKTKAERQASGDPRLSIEERYPNGMAERTAAYERAVAKLVADRYLLSEDATKMIAALTRPSSQ
jgi:hypothetical protein